MRKAANQYGAFADVNLSIKEATMPRTTTSIRCFAVVREIQRQYSIAVASPVSLDTSRYLAEFDAPQGIEGDLSIDLVSR